MTTTQFIRKSVREFSHQSLRQRSFLRKKFTFPLTKIYYGPYVCNGILKHRPEKLRGLMVGLKELCISIELIPVNKLNYLEINTWGYVIHQANITYFKFNTDFENDPVLRNSLAKIEEALIRLLDDNNTTRNDKEPPAQDLSTEYDLSDSSSLEILTTESIAHVGDGNQNVKAPSKQKN